MGIRSVFVEELISGYRDGYIVSKRDISMLWYLIWPSLSIARSLWFKRFRALRVWCLASERNKTRKSTTQVQGRIS